MNHKRNEILLETYTKIHASFTFNCAEKIRFAKLIEELTKQLNRSS